VIHACKVLGRRESAMVSHHAPCKFVGHQQLKNELMQTAELIVLLKLAASQGRHTQAELVCDDSGGL
jgi:hypothetical protein